MVWQYMVANIIDLCRYILGWRVGFINCSHFLPNEMEGVEANTPVVPISQQKWERWFGAQLQNQSAPPAPNFHSAQCDRAQCALHTRQQIILDDHDYDQEDDNGRNDEDDNDNDHHWTCLLCPASGRISLIIVIMTMVVRTPTIVDIHDYNEENEDDDGDLNWSHPPHTRRPHTATHHSVPL